MINIVPLQRKDWKRRSRGGMITSHSLRIYLYRRIFYTGRTYSSENALLIHTTAWRSFNEGLYENASLAEQSEVLCARQNWFCTPAKAATGSQLPRRTISLSKKFWGGPITTCGQDIITNHIYHIFLCKIICYIVIKSLSWDSSVGYWECIWLKKTIIFISSTLALERINSFLLFSQ